MLKWLLPGPSNSWLNSDFARALRGNVFEYSDTVARCGQERCTRRNLAFRTPGFSPAHSRRCVFGRNIYALFARLTLFADLPRQVRQGASVRPPFRAQPRIAVVNSPPAATVSFFCGAYCARALVLAART